MKTTSKKATWEPKTAIDVTYTIIAYVPGLPLRDYSAGSCGVKVDEITVTASSASEALDKARALYVERDPLLGQLLTLQVPARDMWRRYKPSFTVTNKKKTSKGDSKRKKS